MWTEYENCSGGKVVCICWLQVSHVGEVYTLEHCHSSVAAGVRKLPQMALASHGISAPRQRMRVLESRKGQIITLIFSYGGRVRIRMEQWGMSVSVVDVGQDSEQTLDGTIGGLCNKGMKPSGRHPPAPLDASGAELCTCAPTEKVYLSNAITNHPLCDSGEDADCPSGCQVQAAVQWEPLLNYVDISEQIRTGSAIDHPQSDIDPASAPMATYRQADVWNDSPNLGNQSSFTVLSTGLFSAISEQFSESFHWSFQCNFRAVFRVIPLVFSVQIQSSFQSHSAGLFSAIKERFQSSFSGPFSAVSEQFQSHSTGLFI